MAASVDKQGNGPLHLSALNGHSDCVELLLQHKADVAMKNTRNETAMEIMRHSTTPGAPGIRRCRELFQGAWSELNAAAASRALELQLLLEEEEEINEAANLLKKSKGKKKKKKKEPQQKEGESEETSVVESLPVEEEEVESKSDPVETITPPVENLAPQDDCGWEEVAKKPIAKKKHHHEKSRQGNEAKYREASMSCKPTGGQSSKSSKPRKTESPAMLAATPPSASKRPAVNLASTVQSGRSWSSLLTTKPEVKEEPKVPTTKALEIKTPPPPPPPPPPALNIKTPAFKPQENKAPASSTLVKGEISSIEYSSEAKKPPGLTKEETKLDREQRDAASSTTLEDRKRAEAGPKPTPPQTPTLKGASYAATLSAPPPSCTDLDSMGGEESEVSRLTKMLEAASQRFNVLSAENENLKANKRLEEQSLQDLNPCASELDINPASVLGIGLNELSVSQLDALEDVHKKALEALKVAKKLVLERGQKADSPGFAVHAVPGAL